MAGRIDCCGGSILALPRIEFVLSLDSEKQNWRLRLTSGSENGPRKKATKKMARKPLESHETAKLEISGHNDFNGLRGCLAKQNRFASEIYQFASEISPSQANLQTVSVSCGRNIHIET